MSDKQQFPKLQFADNIPVTLTLETQPEQAKEFPNKFDETKPQHMYFATVTDPDNGVEEKHIWFATDRQHKELLAKGAVLGGKYELVNRKYPGDKYASFIVRDLSAQSTTTKPSDDLPTLEDYLNDSEAEQKIGSEIETPINAFKTQGPTGNHQHAIDSWCALKLASQSMGVRPMDPDHPGFNGWMKEIKVRARELLAAHQELMAE